MLNALTIDVGDYYIVSAFADVVRFEDWHQYDSRVEMNTKRILALLDEHDVKATFFILGWIGEQFPELVRDISCQRSRSCEPRLQSPPCVRPYTG